MNSNGILKLMKLYFYLMLIILIIFLVGGFDTSSLDEKTESSEKTTKNGKVLVAVLLGVTGVGILSLGGDQPSMAAVSSEYGTRRLLQSDGSNDPFANFLPVSSFDYYKITD